MRYLSNTFYITDAFGRRFKFNFDDESVKEEDDDDDDCDMDDPELMAHINKVTIILLQLLVVEI